MCEDKSCVCGVVDVGGGCAEKCFAVWEICGGRWQYVSGLNVRL